MGIFQLVQAHGVAPVVAGVLCVKAVKYKLVCWRSAHVNGKVCAQIEDKLEDLDDENEDSQHRARDHQTVRSEPIKIKLVDGSTSCASCECPLWLRRDAVEQVVQLDECGCVVHLGCLHEAAKSQHGIGLHSGPLMPASLLELDACMDQVWAVVWRFVGLSSVRVVTISCPRCRARSSSWRTTTTATVTEMPRRLASPVASPLCGEGVAAVAATLRRGDALCINDLRDALIALGGGAKASDLQRWWDAAKSEAGLRTALKQRGGQQASVELSELMEKSALAGGDDEDGEDDEDAAVQELQRTSKSPGPFQAAGARGVKISVQAVGVDTFPPGGKKAIAQHTNFLWCD